MKTQLATFILLLLVPPTSAQTTGSWIWAEEAKLAASDGSSSDHFGFGVSLSDNTALVGSVWDSSFGMRSGSAYVFERSGTTWSEQTKLLASDGADGDWFGCSVCVDGDSALVGAMWAGGDVGAAYLFVRSGSSWVEQAKLRAPTGDVDDYFGDSVSLDGDTAIVGAPGDDDAGSGAGAAYVFIRAGSTWSQQAKLIGANVVEQAGFGQAVAISGDTALVGSPYAPGGGSSPGGAYLFVRTGSSWSEQAFLTPSDGDNYDRFGSSVALDGETALVGSPDDDDGGEQSGAAYVFVRSGTSWSEQRKLKGQHPGGFDQFAATVSLDGDLALIGARYDDDGIPDSGSASVFVRSGTSWSEEQVLRAPVPRNGARFGADVSIDGDGVLVGAQADDGAEPTTGAAYLFLRVSTPGVGYCFGDPGTGTPCPCSNDNDGSVPGSGCDNGVFASGAQLDTSGRASVSDDTLALHATHAEPLNYGLFFQGNNRVGGGAGTVFGDGLRCAGGGVIRLQVTSADSVGSAQTTIAIGSKGRVSAGDTKRYQYWYRTNYAPPCGLFVNDFNLTNGHELTWLP